jgi:MFS family permease
VTPPTQPGATARSARDQIRVHAALNNLLAASFIMAWHTTLPLVPVYATSLGATPFIVGLVVASNVILPLLLALQVGAAADRFGTTRVARWSAVLFVASYLFVISSRSLELLALGLAGIGLADVGLVVSAQTYVAITSTAENRDNNFAHLTIWISLGALVGPVLGGFLADQWGFQAAFAGSLTLALLTLAIAWVLPNPRRVRAGSPEVTPNAAQALRQAVTLVRDPAMGFVLLTNASLMFATSVRQSFFPLYLRSVGLSTTLIGVMFSLNSLSQMAIRPTIGIAVQHLRHVGVLAMALCFTVVGLAATPWLTSFWALAVAFCISGFGNGFMQPLTMSLVSGRATSSTRGLVIGLRMTVNQIAQVAGPPCFGLVVGAFSLGAAFHVAAAAAVCGFGALARFARVPGRGEPAARAASVAGTASRHEGAQHAGAHTESPQGVLGRPGG